MSTLRDLYVNQLRHDFERLGKSSWYLSQLASRGAIEVDSYIQGINHDFSHVKELAEILEEHQPNETNNNFLFNFPYIPLLIAMEKDSNKKIRHYSELALEMGLLRLELRDISNSKRPEEIRSVLCDIGTEFLNNHRQFHSRRGLAA